MMNLIFHDHPRGLDKRVLRGNLDGWLASSTTGRAKTRLATIRSSTSFTESERLAATAWKVITVRTYCEPISTRFAARVAKIRETGAGFPALPELSPRLIPVIRAACSTASRLLLVWVRYVARHQRNLVASFPADQEPPGAKPRRRLRLPLI